MKGRRLERTESVTPKKKNEKIYNSFLQIFRRGGLDIWWPQMQNQSQRMKISERPTSADWEYASIRCVQQ